MVTGRRLTADEETEIRALYASTAELPRTSLTTSPNPEAWTHRRLAERFGVSREKIRRVITKEEDRPCP